MTWPVCLSADGSVASGAATTPSTSGPREPPATGGAYGRAFAPCRNTPICNSKCDGCVKVPCPAAPRLLMSASGRLVTWLIQFVGGTLQARKNNRYKRAMAIDGRRHISASNGRRPNPPAKMRSSGVSVAGLGPVTCHLLPGAIDQCRRTPAAAGSIAELLN